MLWSLVCVVALSAATFAQSPRKLHIKSAHDEFDLIVNSKTSGTVDGKATKLGALAELWPVVDNPLGNECPSLKGTPDATLTENHSTRSLYFKQGLVTDGKACMNVSGEGLYYFPVHRDFLVGKSQDGITLTTPVKIFRQGSKILEIRRDRGTWVNDNKAQMLNWDFVERFENSLKDFDVRLRVQNELATGKPKMIMQSGGQPYEFYKITKVMWAVKKPGAQWLEASDDWSFWYDFETSLVEDRFAPEIRVLEKPDATDRPAAMQKLEGLWSRNLRDVYHKMVLNLHEDPALQRQAMERLKRKPSLETSGVMVRVLTQTRDEDMKRIAGQILKTYYPKGPLYKPSLRDTEKAKAIEYWNRWWKQNSKES